MIDDISKCSVLGGRGCTLCCLMIEFLGIFQGPSNFYVLERTLLFENYWSFTYFYFHEICMFSILMLFYDVVKTEIRLLIQKVFQSVLVSYL